MYRREDFHSIKKVENFFPNDDDDERRTHHNNNILNDVHTSSIMSSHFKKKIGFFGFENYSRNHFKSRRENLILKQELENERRIECHICKDIEYVDRFDDDNVMSCGKKEEV